MMQFLYDVGLFFVEVLIFAIALVVVIGLIVKIIIGVRGVESEDSKLIIRDYAKKFKEEQQELISHMLSKEEAKKQIKLEKIIEKKKNAELKKQLKSELKSDVSEVENLAKKGLLSDAYEAKTEKTNDSIDQHDGDSKDSNQVNSEVKNADNLFVKTKKVLYIADFNGSVEAKEVSELRKIISLISSNGDENDELLLRLTSPGGTVNGYGLCAAELERLKSKKIKLTIAVDEVAASGGYMMACVADHLMAAPFSYIGSIGVVAEFPNFNRLLKKYDVDYEQVTAGECKRTLTQFGENTAEAREKFKESLRRVHVQFKEHVHAHRPNLDIEKIGNGEHWLAKEALELGLVDELKTSDEYIMESMDKFDHVVSIAYAQKKKKGLLDFLHDKSALADFCVLLLRKLNVTRNKF